MPRRYCDGDHQWGHRWKSSGAVHKIQLELSWTAHHQGMEALVPPEAGKLIY